MFQGTSLKEESPNRGQIDKILLALIKARGPAPLDYISLHSGIKEPLKLLVKMEKMSLVHRVPSSTWSCCMDPMYEIASTL